MTAPYASESDVLETIRAALAPHGLFLRGTINFAPGEAGPTLEGGKPAACVVLIGNVGGSVWEPFRRWREGEPDGGGAEPLDNWSNRSSARRLRQQAPRRIFRPIPLGSPSSNGQCVPKG